MNASLRRAAWLVAGLFSLRLAIATWESSSVPANGFVTHWTASRLVLAGENVASFYDDAWFVARVHEAEPTVYDIFGPNPPTVALVAVPVVGLPYTGARRIVAIVSVVLWIGGAVWLAATLMPGSLLGPLLVCVAALFHPAEEGLRHAQLHIPVFTATLVAWSHWRRSAEPRDDAIAGAMFGSMLALKAAGAIFWVLLIAQRRWRTIATALATVLLFTIAALPVARADAWSAFVARARVMSASGVLSATAYQTVPGAVRRLTVASPRWNPRPLVRAGRAGIALSWITIAALVLGTAVVAARRASIDDAMFAATSALAVAVSPVSLHYHYTLTLLPIAILASLARNDPSVARAVALALATLLIAARLPYVSPRVADGAMVLFAYPKLVGALVLWWLALTSRHADAVRIPMVTAERLAAA